MFTDIENKLIELGGRLKKSRLDRDDSQKEFAFRIGVSIPTLYKMEKGDFSISLGKWAQALSVLNMLDQIDNLFAAQESLFDLAQKKEKQKLKQRASRKIK